MASTNGSWLRLSCEGESSSLHPLIPKSVFKIGNSAMYEVIDESVIETKEIVSPDSCAICWTD